MSFSSDNNYSSSSESESDIDSNLSDTSDILEPQRYYKPGGYHPVSIGSKLHRQRYHIKKRLGWGYFSTVWLAFDTVSGDYVAIKICKSDEPYFEAAQDEIKILETIQSTIKSDLYVIRMRDHFVVHGENGSHIAIVFDTMFKDLLYISTEIGKIPLYFVKRIAFQVLRAVDQLHQSGIIHTDIKPENFLIGLPKNLNSTHIEEDSVYQKRLEIYNRLRRSIRNLGTMKKLNKNQKRSLKKKRLKLKNMSHPRNFKPRRDKTISFENPFVVKIADLGNACWINKHFTDNVTTTQYRSPEVLLQTKYSTPIDLFSCGILFFELATGELLFNPEETDDCCCEEIHLNMMIQILGKIPRYLRNCSMGRRFFNRKGFLKHVKPREQSSIYKELKKFNLDESEIDIRIFSTLLERLLDVDPQTRISAKDALNHPFFKDLDPNDIHRFPSSILKKLNSVR